MNDAKKALSYYKNSRMNRYRIRAFGITKDLLGGRDTTIEIRGTTVGELKEEISERFPELSGLKSLFVAVNNDYADDDRVLQPTDEIALIPPVSGG
jgi:molybdopterin synthase sulfur carrier subunit